MRLDGAHRDVQPRGDLRIGQTIAEQAQHVCFPRGDARRRELVGDGSLGSAPARDRAARLAERLPRTVGGQWRAGGLVEVDRLAEPANASGAPEDVGTDAGA